MNNTVTISINGDEVIIGRDGMYTAPLVLGNEATTTVKNLISLGFAAASDGPVATVRANRAMKALGVKQILSCRPY